MGEGGDGLDGGAHDDVLARADAPFDAAVPVGVVRPGAIAPAVGGEDDVVGLGAALLGRLEAEPEADALEGVDAADGLGDAAVELAVPLDVGAEAEGHAGDAHLDLAAERVAVGLGGVDGGDHLLGGGGVGAADGVGLDGLPVDGFAGAGTDTADGEGVAAEGDAELVEEALGDARDGDAGGPSRGRWRARGRCGRRRSRT